jgi:hypothetical protein
MFLLLHGKMVSRAVHQELAEETNRHPHRHPHHRPPLLHRYQSNYSHNHHLRLLLRRSRPVRCLIPLGSRFRRPPAETLK